jgi:hypothetical protein
LGQVDQLVGHLVESLTEARLLDSLNLVVTGLHGFAEVSAEHVFDITNLAATEDYVVYGHTPVLNLQPVDVNKELDIYAALQKELTSGTKYSLYTYQRFHILQMDLSRELFVRCA